MSNLEHSVSQVPAAEVPEHVRAIGAFIAAIYPGQGVEQNLTSDHIDRFTASDYQRVWEVRHALVCALTQACDEAGARLAAGHGGCKRLACGCRDSPRGSSSSCCMPMRTSLLPQRTGRYALPPPHMSSCKLERRHSTPPCIICEGLLWRARWQCRGTSCVHVWHSAPTSRWCPGGWPMRHKASQAGEAASAVGTSDSVCSLCSCPMLFIIQCS